MLVRNRVRVWRSHWYIPRLATSRLANIFGNDTIYRHDKKKIEKGKKKERNGINRAPKARASFEVPMPQVHSLIFLVMIRYTGTIKKNEKGKKKPEIN